MSPLDLGPPQIALLAGLVLALGVSAGACLTLWAQRSDYAAMQRAIALLITFLWVVVVLASMVMEHRPSPFVHGMMGAVAAYLFRDEAGEVRWPVSVRR